MRNESINFIFLSLVVHFLSLSSASFFALCSWNTNAICVADMILRQRE